MIGVLVGLIIVYQVLSSDVADHIREYATFKAIGYRQRFFLGLIFEEAVILAILGFIPGFLFALALYAIVAAVTSLPLAMTAPRALGVLAARSPCARSPAPSRPASSPGPIRPISSERHASPDATPAEPPIAVRGLNHWFGEGEARKQALHAIDVTIERGRLTVLLGASGSGKTRC